MIVCIKVGENELPTYYKFAKLSKHLDIIEVLPRKARGGEHRQQAKADREYFMLNVNTDTFTDDEFKNIRHKLREEWTEPILDPQTLEVIGRQRIAKRLRQIDLSDASISNIGLSKATVNKINVCADKRRSKQGYDMAAINRIDIKVPFNMFAKVVVNKQTGQTLEEELA